MPGWAIPNCDAKIDAIVVASINRYMTALGYVKQGAHYMASMPDDGGEQAYVYVSCPDSKGAGGGVVETVGDVYVSPEERHRYKDDFAYIRTTIQKACSPLHDSLPTSVDLNQLCERIAAIGVKLNVYSGQQGQISADVATVEGLANLIKDGQYAAIMSTVVNRVRGVIASIGDVVRSMQSIAQSEKDVIEAFQKNLGPAMDKLAVELPRKTASITLAGVLSVVTWGIDVVSAVATGNVAAGAKAGVTALQGIYTIYFKADKGDAQAAGLGQGRDAGARAVNESIMNGKQSLNWALRDAEDKLAELVDTLGNRIASQTECFDIEPAGILMKASGLEVSERDAVKSVADQTLPSLANELRAIARDVSGLNASLVFSRHGGIGRSPNGVASEFNKLVMFVVSALDALAYDLETFGYSLHDYVSDLERNEAESAARLSGVSPMYPGDPVLKGSMQKILGSPR